VRYRRSPRDLEGGGGLIHPIQRRFEAEDLVRRRRSDEQARTASSQRQGRIDPNPHQIDAVMFALGRIPEGGCILADEVGLGKTIEAGLVLAQLRAEGKRRLLIIVPKPLLGQWHNELFTLFGMEARIGSARPDAFNGTGVFIVGRELAGTETVSRILASGEPFDLVVMDEAHELFAGIYRRYDLRGNYREESKDALIAQRVREAIGAAPVLLLTATPIQNSLAELWGLVQYVEPTGTLLGTLDTFRKVFCPGDDEMIAEGQDDELRRRMSSVCQRTLRRQAQEFLERPFVQRRCRLFEYTMEPDERALYDDVTRWLLEPDLVAFSGGSRHLLLLGFHRRMASSTAALASSLERVCARLKLIVRGELVRDTAVREFLADLEEDDEDIDAEVSAPKTHADPARARTELERVRTFAGRARRLGPGAKAATLLQALKQLGRRKVLVFTESIATQDFLFELLITNGFASTDVTLFRGTNDSPRAMQALNRWLTEQPPRERVGRDIALRLALVHEFKTRSRVMIATEAGAKGLNLQFCDVVVNYDLPWNPQRIEQRIGRSHRYGQEHDVTVVNFISADNEADRLTFEILARKLDLFGRVLDASDHVLHEPATDAPESIAGSLGVAVERELQRIHEQARSMEQLVRELEGLRDEVDARRRSVEDGWRRAASLIQSRLDEEVQRVFRRIRDDLPKSLAAVDRAVDRVVTAYLDARAISHRRSEKDGRILLDVDGTRFVIGNAKGIEGAEPLHIGHSLVVNAIEDARRASAEVEAIRINPAQASPKLREMRGQRGRLVIVKAGYAGFEPVDRLIVLAATEGRMLDPQLARELLTLPMEAGPSDIGSATPDELIDDAVDEAVFLDQEGMEAGERARFDAARARLERSVEDRVLILRRLLTELERRKRNALGERDRALSVDAREAAERTLRRLEGEGSELEMALVELERRTDEPYRMRRELLTLRRTTAPTVERLVDVGFEIL
jgi:adenine-specific DNA-methyltransferase